jgi:hypothetical protein
MFLHLGADTVILLSDVITITDFKTIRSGINDDFLRVMKEENLVEDIADGNAKSFIVTDRKVFLSAISAATLKKRAQFLSEDEEE